MRLSAPPALAIQRLVQQGRNAVMDGLLGSIDVQELLSSGYIDESPLPAPDLCLLIDRLQIHSLHVKSKVRDYVLSHNGDFAEIFSRCTAAGAGADDTAAALADAIHLLSGRPVESEIWDIARQTGNKLRELEERREALAVVRTMSCLLEKLKAAKEDVRAGRLVEAAVAVRDLKSGMRVPEGEHENRGEEEPAIFGFLRKELSECFGELQCVLLSCIENLIQFEPDNGTLTVWSCLRSGQPNELDLHRVLESMEIGGILDYGLAKVAGLIMKHVITPAITNKCIHVLEKTNQDSAAVLTINQSSKCQGGSVVVAFFYSLGQIIKFIYKFICFENGVWMQCFGRLTWSRMSDLIILHFLSKVVPQDAGNMAEFENTVRCTSDFENSLKELKFVSFENSGPERLSHFAHNVEIHFASKKKTEILARARNILLQFSFLEATSNSGMLSLETCERPELAADLLFQPERCFLSSALCQVLQLVHETLKDACLSSASVAKELYHAARNVLLLYKAIIPIKLEKHFNNVSQQAIIVHNDCFYLSQEILGLAFEYRADFPSCLKKFVVFVDIAPGFYHMAENILQRQIQLVVNNLKEAIDGADGFQNSHQPKQFELAEFSINQVVFILEKVRDIWEPLMAASTYRRSMCILLDTLFSRITKDLLLLDDMAAEETLQIQRLIHMAFENLSPLFQSVVIDVDKRDKLLKESSLSMLDELIPTFSKLRRLADMLDMPLKSITSMWESGELLNCCFTSSEVVNFISAVFSDSPLRKECLWRIESAKIM